MQILTRCQGDRCVVNRGGGLMTVDFDGGDAAMVGVIVRSEGQREKSYGHGVGKMPLLVGADAKMVVREKNGLIQKDALVEE
ncbi:hypothetical protein BHM03_00022761 [Ensete ventricosum]|nr:hypothetical protein BHM03_00022761 [Ensete ventricosum]